MIAFGSAVAGSSRAEAAAASAAREALDALAGARPVVAVVFASASYEDLDRVTGAVASVVGPVPVVGGTSGACVIGPDRVLPRGVSVVILGGDGIEAVAVNGTVATAELQEAVPAAARIATAADDAAKRGLVELTCLAFAPSMTVDGAALTAAVRKGAGARAQLAGGLTGDELTFDRSRVFADGAVRADAFTIAGLFTRAPLGVAARHGWRPVGPPRTITRAEGAWLVTLDGRPALDVWREDARAAGGSPPPADKDVSLYLANHYPLGLVHEPAREAVVRAPFGVRADGAVLLGASVPERAIVRVTHASHAELLAASRDAARAAKSGTSGPLAGALVFACTGRLIALGDAFPGEPAAIASELGAPVGGSCVYGEIARARRDVEAFHNSTAVVVAIPAA